MFIFILPVLFITTSVAFFTASGGMTFVFIASTMTEWQRRHGYKGGEGRLTEREGGHYYATKPDINSDHDISLGLGLLAQQLPSVFEPYVNKRYDFTKSEGAQLRAMVIPAMSVLNDLEETKASLGEDPGNEELQVLLLLTIENLGMLVNPIVIFLEQFPRKRVKKWTPEEQSSSETSTDASKSSQNSSTS